MQHIVLHIGHRKVGSTSIQRIFAQNTSVLATRGIVYPERGTTQGAHHNLAYQLSSDFSHRFRVERGTWDEALDEIAHNRGIVSSEAFTFLKPDEINALASILNGKAAVVLYLRRYDLWFRSQFNQHAKFGRAGGLRVESWLAEKFCLGSFAQTLAAWQAAFPVNCILTSHTLDVVNHFVRLCDVHGLVGTDARHNTSVSLKQLVAAALVNLRGREIMGGDFRLTRHTAFAISRFFRPRPDWVASYSLFSLEHARSIEANCRPDAEKLALLTGQRFAPIADEDYANYVADPMAFANRFDAEESVFLDKLTWGIRSGDG